MKRLVLAAFLVAFETSCTPETTSEELENNGIEVQATDKDKNCAPNDRNCNGIPDNQEG